MKSSAIFMQHVYWLTLLVIFPLATNPFAFVSGSSSEAVLLMPRASVLCIVWIVGIIAALSSFHDMRLVQVPRLVLKSTMFVKTVIVLLGILLISAFLTDGPLSVTLVGSPSRLDGVALQILWYSLALISFTLMRSDLVRPVRVIGYFIVGAVLVGLWALLQTLGIEPMSILDSTLRSSGSAIGPFGNPAIVSGFVAIALSTLVSYSVLGARLKVHQLIAIAFLSVVLIASEGRSGFVAFVVMWVALGIGVLSYRVKLKRYFVVSMVVVVAGGTYSLTPDSGVQELSTLYSAARGVDLDFSLRAEIFWPVAVRGILERPLLGWGPDGYSRVFWKHSTEREQEAFVFSSLQGQYEEIRLTGSPIQMVRKEGEEDFHYVTYTVDRAHNFYLDTAVSFGLIGLLAGLLFVTSGFVVILRSPQTESLALAFGVGAFLIFGLAWFGSLLLDPIVWGIFGAAVGAAKLDRSKLTSQVLEPIRE